MVREWASSSTHSLLRAQRPCPVWHRRGSWEARPLQGSHLGLTTLPTTPFLTLLADLFSPGRPGEHPTLPQGLGEPRESEGNLESARCVTPAPHQGLVWSEGQSLPHAPSQAHVWVPEASWVAAQRAQNARLPALLYT